MRTTRKTTLLARSLAIVTMIAAVGCHGGANAAENEGQIPVQNLDQGPDPAAANLAPASATGVQQAEYQQPYQSGQQGAPIERRAPSPETYAQGYDPSQYADQDADAGQPPMEADQPPPPLPEYDQPDAPDPDYLWTPGYWAWGPEGYYWVPGAWCAPPYEGALWTPGYWYFSGGHYRFHRGYWGPYVGFYGGINYGFGYFGTGYVGGFWNGPHFFYNRAVTHVNTSRISNVYDHRVATNNVSGNRVSFNGGRGGIAARPTPSELTAARVPHTPPMTTQLQTQRAAAQNRDQLYSQNKGKPVTVVAAKPITADRGIQRPVNPIADNRPGRAPSPEPNRPAEQAQPGIRPTPGHPDVRPAQPESRQPEARPAQPQARPQPEARQPEARPVPQPQARPQPEVRQPEGRPAPQPQARPQSEARQPEVRPAPQPEARPAPQPVRPAPQPYRPQPEARPAPQPQARPQPAPAPRPQARPAAPPPRPAPEPKPEEKPR